MKLEEYVFQGSKRLRCGYTTGSCAALAAQAAAKTLLTGTPCHHAHLLTPKGILLEVPVEELEIGEDFVRCAVQKDSGDDPDITDGILIVCEIKRTNGCGITIEGGEGVGRVTKRGLDQPVGAAAINRVPRQMISHAVEEVCEETGYDGGLLVTVSIPKGKELAGRTFNPRLGIEGGLSILGTTGIVEPMSEQALVDSLELEIKIRAQEQQKLLILAPGNYGTDFIQATSALQLAPVVKCSNYIGDAVEFGVRYGFSDILLVGHIGKLVKLAAGVRNTHSRYADCRLEILTAHAALAGCSRETAAELMESATTDEAVRILKEQGLLEAVLPSILQKIEDTLSRFAGEGIRVGAVVFGAQGLLGMTQQAKTWIGRNIE